MTDPIPTPSSAPSTPNAGETPTPRADAAARMPTDSHPHWVVDVSVARQLERELAAALKELSDLRIAYVHAGDYLKERDALRAQLAALRQQLAAINPLVIHCRGDGSLTSDNASE